MKILSLFSGIGAFEKALERQSIPHEIIGYCEIDKYASKAYSLLHDVPESLNLGDITEIDANTLPMFDILSWGFPCQDISAAGQQKGITTTTRSGLYYHGLRIIRATLPKYSIIENVKNLVSKKFKNHFDNILQNIEDLGYNNYWQVLNAKDYGIPQNRERVFIVSIRKDVDDGRFLFPEPFDNGLRLKEMLEDSVDEKYFISEEKTKKLLDGFTHTQDFSYAIDANYYKGPSLADMTNGKRQCVAVLTPERVEKRQNGRRFKEDGEPMFTLTGQDRYGVLTNECHCVGRIEGINGHDYLKRVYSDKGTSPTIPTCCGGNHEPKVLTSFRIRKLTPIECWRLMGFDDADINKCIEAGISNSQLYKMAGNSIVVDVLEEIFKKLFERR